VEVSEWIAVVSVVVALVSLTIQQHLSHKQNKAEARTRHYERTQTLLLKALDDPDLLNAIGDQSDHNQKHRRYWQLWLNHIEIIFRQRYLFDDVHWQGTANDIRGFANMPPMRKHWEKYRADYADDFQQFMKEEILEEKAEAPNTETST